VLSLPSEVLAVLSFQLLQSQESNMRTLALYSFSRVDTSKRKHNALAYLLLPWPKKKLMNCRLCTCMQTASLNLWANATVLIKFPPLKDND
jgi:hypothetical protein